MGIASDISVRFNLTENPLILLLLHSFHPSSTVFLEPYVWHCFFNVSFVIWLHNYPFLIDYGCLKFSLLQRMFPDEK